LQALFALVVVIATAHGHVDLPPHANDDGTDLITGVPLVNEDGTPQFTEKSSGDAGGSAGVKAGVNVGLEIPTNFAELDGMTSQLTGGLSKIGQGLGAVGGTLAEGLGAVGKGLLSGLASSGSAISGIINFLKSLVEGIIKAILKILGALTEQIDRAEKSLFNQAGIKRIGGFKSFLSDLKGQFSSAGKQATGGLDNLGAEAQEWAASQGGAHVGVGVGVGGPSSGLGGI